MTDSDSESEDPPYTTEDLSDSRIAKLDIEDQIRYAIYNGHYRLAEIVEISAFSEDWTTEIVEEMVRDGDLVEGTDDEGLFYELPEDEINRGFSDEERAEIHAKARRELEAEETIGDPDDVEAALGDADTSGDGEAADAHASAAETVTTSISDPTPDAVPDEAPGWYEALVEDAEAGELDHPLPEWEEIARSMGEHGGLLPVDRDYDWEDRVIDPDDVENYISADGEYEDIAYEIETRRETGKLPHFCISGPTGCGKTTLPENVAAEMKAPVFEIHCHEGLRPSNLLGMPTYVGDETWWIDGPAPKALLCSQERPTFVILDEVNRTSSRTLGVLMSMLDHQASVTLDARGGETVEGDPMNLIVFSTMNEGEGYVVNSVDTAQKRRLGNKFYTDYIGMHDAREEAELIADRTPVSPDVALTMVECANDIREKAQSDSAVSMGVPTSTMLDWAATAWAYRDRPGEKGPLVKAGRRSVLNKFFRGDDREEDTVRSIIETHLEDMDVLHETADEESGDELESVKEAVDDEDDTIDVDEETYLMCESCGWYELAEDAEEEVVVEMSCPECDAMVTPRETT